MGLRITPVTFYPFTTVASADMNSNFTSVQTASRINGSWNTSNNAAIQLTLNDTTVNSNAVIQFQPGAGNANRGISLAYNNNGTITDCMYIDPATGYVHVPLHFLDSAGPTSLNQNRAQPGAFFTGTGSGTYSHGCLSTPTYCIATVTGATSPQQISTDTPGSTTVAIHSGGSHFNGLALTGG